MSEIQNEFIRGVGELKPREHINYVKDFERRAAKDPKGCAEEALRELIAGQAMLARLFKQVFGETLKTCAGEGDLVLPDHPELREFFLVWLRWLQFYDLTLDFFRRCLAAPGGPNESHARTMCACFVRHELASWTAYLAVADDIAEQFPDERRRQALVEQFTAFFVAHTSLHRNKTLWKAIHELKEPNETHYERLIKEMSAEVWSVWREKRAAWTGKPFHPNQLMEMRTEIARRLEGRSAPPKEAELAAFADRELMLKQGREAGLAPREYELFKLLVETPGIKNREVAEKLGVSVGTVGKTKSRIRQALAEAG